MTNIAQMKDIQPLQVPPAVEFSEFQPFNDDEIHPPHLPVECLPKWLGDYCSELSLSTQTPIDMAITFSLSILATCLQGRVKVVDTTNGQTEAACLWTLTSMAPGSRKSAIVNPLRAPLTAWQNKQKEKLKPLIAEDEVKRTTLKKRLEELQKQAVKPNSDLADFQKQMAEIHLELDKKPVRAPQVWTDNVTTECLENLVQQNDGRMAILSDEGGNFEVMTGLYSNGAININVYLQGYDGSDCRTDRNSRHIDIPNAHVTLGFCVQPEVLKGLARNGKQKLQGLGALGRFLFAIPRSTVGTRNVRHARVVDHRIKEIYDFNIERLLELPINEPIKLTLDQEATEVFKDFHQFVEDRSGLDGEYGNFNDWSSKHHGKALRIAALFHVAEHWTRETVINRDTMERAVKLCMAFIPHAQTAYSQMTTSQAVDDAKFLLPYLAGRDEIARAFLADRGRFTKSPAERLDTALAVLRSRGYISEVRKISGGKQVMSINPEFNSHPRVVGVVGVEKFEP